MATSSKTATTEPADESALNQKLAVARMDLPPAAYQRFEENILRENEAKKQAQYARDLLDAIEVSTHLPRMPKPPIPKAIGEVITQRIEEHKRMIRTLEWFGAHLALDEPGGDLLVSRVIFEGLEAIMAKTRDGRL